MNIYTSSFGSSVRFWGGSSTVVVGRTLDLFWWRGGAGPDPYSCVPAGFLNPLMEVHVVPGSSFRHFVHPRCTWRCVRGCLASCRDSLALLFAKNCTPATMILTNRCSRLTEDHDRLIYTYTLLACPGPFLGSHFVATWYFTFKYIKILRYIFDMEFVDWNYGNKISRVSP